MDTLRSVALGLLVVFLDVGSNGWDWVADPAGWILVLLGLSPLKEVLPAHTALVVTAWVCLAVSVLTFTPGSVASIAPVLGWLFSLPTLAFCFLLCDSLGDAVESRDPSLAVRVRWLRTAFVVVAALPLLVYGFGLDEARVPIAVLAVACNVLLLFWVWSAGDNSGEEAAAPARRPPDGFDAEEVKRRVRRRASDG